MRLLLISLDGLWEGDFLRLQQLPHIGGLIRRGTSCHKVQTVYPALTYPIHASIVTGGETGAHGIPHNHPFAPYLPGNMQEWYWDANDIKLPTLHQLFYEKGKKVASILWPVTGKSRYIHKNFPEVLALPGESQTLKMLQYGTAPWILATELRYGRKRKSTKQPDLDDYATLLAVKLLEGRKAPDLLTLHLVDCDEMRHQHGADSPEAHQAIERLDRRVGELLAALEKKDRLRDTVVALVSDHGLWNVETPVYLNARLAKAGLLSICQAQSTGMGAYLHINPPTPENVEKVAAFLSLHKEALGIACIYDREALRAMGAERSLHLAVEAAPGIAFQDSLVEKEGLSHKATHGFGPSHPAAQCLFVMAGPGVEEGERIDRMNIIDIKDILWKAVQ